MEDSVAAIEKFRELLRIPSVSSNGSHGSYQATVDWIAAYVNEYLKLPFEIVSFREGKPIILVTWIGTESTLPCIFLHSHYDVVPAIREYWTVDPFAAVRKDNGRIYGRGTQDMKCVCVQYLEAVKRLLLKNWKPRRTVYLHFTPDEEIGGADGMEAFLQSEIWNAIQPVGLVLDEGLANPGNSFTVFYGERLMWWLLVKTIGPKGNGSRFVENSAMSKLIKVSNDALKFRQQQRDLLGHGGCSHAKAKKLGDVSSLNITMINSGVSLDGGKTFCLNAIPTKAEAGFDVRISPYMQPSEFRVLIDEWCREEGVSWNFAPWVTPLDDHYITSINRDENPWWGIYLDTMQIIGIDIEPEIFPAGTDSMFIRKLGLPVLGFSPIRNTPILLHEHDEWLHEDTFLEGIGIYEKLVESLAGASKFMSEF